MNRRGFLASGLGATFSRSQAAASPRLNVIQILIDDMGYADLGCYGGQASTPNLDRLASEGIRFTQGYVASPICSPSRVGILTGQHPSRHGIYSYLDTREAQKKRGMRDFLDAAAPSVARAFQQAGYATGHFGKWHMGGGRDVDDAPLPTEYGFDESLTSFEGLGDRVLPPGRLSELNAKLGRGNISRAPQRELTRIYVDRAIAFSKSAHKAGKPFYVHLWPNDVHDPFDAEPELLKKYKRGESQKYVEEYLATIESMDRELGRIVNAVDELGVADRTLFVALSDNGPTAWPRYYKEQQEAPGSTGGLRGRKWSLYEGGVRVPLIARWKGHTPAGRVDRTSVVSSLDLFPTCCTLAGVGAPKVRLDGEDRSSVFLGKASAKRRNDLLWEYGRDASYLRPGIPNDQSPNLAIRSEGWKLLMNDDGSRVELYDLPNDPDESENLAQARGDISRRLSERLLTWRRSLRVTPHVSNPDRQRG